MATELATFGGTEGLGTAGLLAEPVGESRREEPFKGFPDTEFAEEAREDALAAAFKAISHPVRMRILVILSCQSDPMCVCHIESRFTLSQPTISHHLRLLRKAGLVSSERSGTWIYYSVRREGVQPLYSFMTSIIRD
ncbi:MAG: metalloregulator ArsR/SmtB family transcription factor [Caldilineaceae bacterium]|nr:metalloregulator ArsR/SmtB family transcription factor [Caldilineaceae bacterium]